MLNGRTFSHSEIGSRAGMPGLRQANASPDFKAIGCQQQSLCPPSHFCCFAQAVHYLNVWLLDIPLYLLGRGECLAVNVWLLDVPIYLLGIGECLSTKHLNLKSAYLY